MNRREQKTFVSDLSATVAADINAKIDAGKVPESWDGHELRRLLADKHADSASMSSARGRGARASAYRNTVLVNDL